MYFSYCAKRNRWAHPPPANPISLIMNIRLPAAVMLICLAPAARADSSVTLYGIVDEFVQVVNTGSGYTGAVGSSGQWASRIGLRGSEDIGGGLHVNFQLEQAFSGQTLSTLNVSGIGDLIKYTPNVTFSTNGPGQGNIAMRGLSASGHSNHAATPLTDQPAKPATPAQTPPAT